MQILRFVRSMKIVSRIKPDGWRVKVEGLSWWKHIVANSCWWLLHKLHAVSQFEHSEQVYHYGEMEQKTITDMMLSCIEQVLERDKI